ncbi:MAG: HAD-IC family P-type ATPase [Geminicoccaceae bacterium]
MATLHREEADDVGRVLVKGAPERLLEMCGTVLTAAGPEPLDQAAWQARIAELAERGERVLAFACKPGHEGLGIDHPDLADGLVLIGLAGIIDPPRDEAIAAVESCHAAGIRVVMITGDHALTARSIARRLGLAENPSVLTGRDLDGMDDRALGRAALETHVFARTTPEHKLRLVQALQAAGLSVAMTGDGVNDAPALKRADVGVAMGRKGTAAARDASEMVLADDKFASIVDAVREGRTVYDNLTKVIAWTLPTNGGEALTIIVAVLAGLTLPITSVQILWVNMVTALALGLTLAFEPTEPGTMERPPRPAGAPLLKRDVVWRVASISLLFVIGVYGVYYWSVARGLPIETARTLVVNTIVAMEIFYLFNVRYVHGASLTWRGVLGTPAVLIGVASVVVLQVAFTYVPWLQLAFGTRALAVSDGLVAVAVGVALFVVVEVEKIVRSRGFKAMRHGN